MDLDDLAEWLEDHDVPYEFCKIMKGKSGIHNAGAIVYCALQHFRQLH